MLSLGITIESITCDGHRSILKAVRKTCKEVMLQRCLVHIQRECKIWLTQNPKSEAGLSLLAIVKRLSQIRTHHEAQHWMREIVDWHTHYQTFVQEKSYSKTTGRYWYKHKLVRRCFIMIKNALPNMFQYLFNDHVPKSTNGLESFFGHLKSHLLLHRGMTKEHRKSFIKWYIYFRNNEQVFLAIGDTNKQKKTGSRLTPCLLYIRKSYCWQVAPQQSLRPLRIYAGNKLNIFVNSTNYFWHHYLQYPFSLDHLKSHLY